MICREDVPGPPEVIPGSGGAAARPGCGGGGVSAGGHVTRTLPGTGSPSHLDEVHSVNQHEETPEPVNRRPQSSSPHVLSRESLVHGPEGSSVTNVFVVSSDWMFPVLKFIHFARQDVISQTDESVVHFSSQ